MMMNSHPQVTIHSMAISLPEAVTWAFNSTTGATLARYHDIKNSIIDVLNDELTGWCWANT